MNRAGMNGSTGKATLWSRENWNDNSKLEKSLAQSAIRTQVALSVDRHKPTTGDSKTTLAETVIMSLM